MQELLYMTIALQLIAVVLMAVFKHEDAKEMNEWLQGL